MTIKEKIITSIKYKLRAIFFISIIVGNLISNLIVSPIFQDKVKGTLTQQYNVVITRLQEYENDKEDLNSLIKLYDDLSYNIERKKDISNIKINKNQMDTLNKDKGICYLTSKKYGIKAVTKINNEYFIISKDINYIRFLPYVLNIWILLMTILISFVIISFATSKIIIPIEKLAKATNKIAEGDFDVKIETKYKDEDELGKLINNFNLMVAELNNLDYMQKDFINNVSHEFKTPIAAVKGYLTILKSENLSQDERLEYINIVLDEINRLSSLSTNILELSKLDNIESFKGNEKFSLDEQIRKTVIFLEKEWGKKNININLNLQPTYYYGKEEYLKQVWLNIINNAIKFSYDNGVINIYSKKSAEEVVVVIEDFGCGMDEKTQKYLFNRFYQGDDSRSESGYGLGLAISKKIIELSSGSIIVESLVNKYTRFTIRLPF